jgi:DNA-binding beta-propeller fold protein YncE
MEMSRMKSWIDHRLRPLLILGALVVAPGSGSVSAAPPNTAGPSDKGFVLPNGWVLTPAGRHVELTDLPLNIVPLADNRRVLVGTDGYNRHQLSLIDLSQKKELAREAVGESWFGLVASSNQDRVWWSGGGSNRIFQYEVGEKSLTRQSFDPALKAQHPGGERAALHHFRSGLLVDAATHTLFSLDINAGRLDVASGNVTQSAPCGGRPYDIALAHNRALLFVSDWAGRTVLAVRPDDLRVISRIAVGEHPNQIVPHPKDNRLFVTCASTNNVAVIDTLAGTLTETIYTPLFPKSPEGSTPDALAITSDGQTLFVANADNNCVALIDISQPSRSQVKGFIPTGWYPTAVAVTPDGKQLLVGVGKGLQTHANANARSLDANQKAQQEVGALRVPFRYIGATLSGALSIVPIPDEAQLAKYTAQVYANCPYSDKLLTGSIASERPWFPLAWETPARSGT